MGRSRGGLTTEAHAAVNGLGHPVGRIATPGQAPDVGQAGALLAGHRPAAVVADRGYDSKALAGAIEGRGGEAVIPTQKSRAEQRDIDRHV